MTGKYAAPVATQSEHPYRAVLRTIFAAIVALAAFMPALIDAIGVDRALPWVAGTLAIAASITRVLAIPAVNGWLQTFIPWLAAAPKQLAADDEEPPGDHQVIGLG